MRSQLFPAYSAARVARWLLCLTPTGGWTLAWCSYVGLLQTQIVPLLDFNHLTNASFRQKPAFSIHPHPTRLVSVPTRHSREKRSPITRLETDTYTRLETDTYTHRKNKIPGTCAMFSCMWRPGCFPGAWWRVFSAFLSRQFAPTINHGPLSASPNMYFFFSLSTQRRRRMPPAERNALYRFQDTSALYKRVGT